MLVGRDRELARLRALLDEAASGRAVAALVSGDAGVGKSRLVAEVAALAMERGFTVLTGQCAEIGDSVPYLPFADALRTAPPALEAAVKARPVLARLLPDAYRDDPDAAGEFRRFTESGLRSGKAQCAQTLLDTLPASGGRVKLTSQEAEAWLRSLNDVRLALGSGWASPTTTTASTRTSSPTTRVSPMCRSTSGWPTSRAA